MEVSYSLCYEFIKAAQNLLSWLGPAGIVMFCILYHSLWSHRIRQEQSWKWDPRDQTANFWPKCWRCLCFPALEFLPTPACSSFSEVQDNFLSYDDHWYYICFLFALKSPSNFFLSELAWSLMDFMWISMWWGTCKNLIVERGLFLGFDSLCWGVRITAFSISGNLGRCKRRLS